MPRGDAVTLVHSHCVWTLRPGGWGGGGGDAVRSLSGGGDAQWEGVEALGQSQFLRHNTKHGLHMHRDRMTRCAGAGAARYQPTCEARPAHDTWDML